MNINQSITNLFKSASLQTKRPSNPIGSGYYALKPNTSAAGIKYMTLVKAFSSKPIQSLIGRNALKPITGHRTDRPFTHRARSPKA